MNLTQLKSCLFNKGGLEEHTWPKTSQKMHLKGTSTRGKPFEIMMFEKMHKTHKDNGDWCDARSEQVATKYDEVVHVAYDDDLESDIPFATDAWVKVVGVPKKDDVYGFGRTQVAKRIGICASSSNKKKSTLYDSTPLDNEVTIESQVDARVESRLESIREEMREERRVEMEQFMKSINDQHNKS